MICISVTPTSRTLAKVDLLNASRHCDLIELCLDHLIKEPNVGELLQGIDKPILVSCRRKEDGGHWQGTEEERIQLLRQAIVAGPAYVELELDVAPDVPRFGETKRVVSYTSLDKPLGKVDSIFDEAWKAKADVVKFTWPTPTLDAAWPLLAAVTGKRELPVVGMGLGQAGITFSLLGYKFGSPWIYAALEKGMEAHEGQATVFEFNELYDFPTIDRKTRLVGVVGLGEAEAETVRVLNAAFRAADMNTRCLPLALGGFDNLAKMFDVLKINGVIVSPRLGGNVFAFAERAEDAAQESTYADLLLKQTDGWTAYNTIWRAVLKTLEDALGKSQPDDRPLDRRNVLLIGSDGLARALAFGIRKRKGIVSITGRNDKQSQAAAEQLGVRHVPFAKLYDTLADVSIVTDPQLPLGHKRDELNPSCFKSGTTMTDVSQLPRESPFINEARTRGCRVVEPQTVFREQLAAQFKAITGQEMPTVDL